MRAKLDVRGGHDLVDQAPRLGVELAREPVQFMPVALPRQDGVGRAYASVAVTLGACARDHPHRLPEVLGHAFLVAGGPAAGHRAEHRHIHRTNPMALPVPADER